MFDMGSPDTEAGRWEAEGPVHRIRLSRPFYMGKYEVTQEQWQKVMGANPSHFKGPRLPVECASWDNILEFLKRLDALGRTKGRFRLPTEAEWEWACRAGTKTRFCFGDDEARLSEYAWYNANAGNTTHPVGEKQPNAWGLHDCHGNVWEWYADAWRSYSPNPWPGKFRWTRDPQGPASSPDSMMRGGSWCDGPEYCRSATRRYFTHPSDRHDFLGFRVVLSIAGP